MALALAPELRQRLNDFLPRRGAGDIRNALCGAAGDGDYYTIVQALLDMGVDVDECDRHRETPVIKAAMKGHLAVVNTLLDAGAETNIVNGFGYSALHRACERGHSEVAVALLHAGADKDALSCGHSTPLILAAREGHLSVVLTMLSHGADTSIRQTMAAYDTALSTAAGKGHVDIVQAIVDHGADVNANRNGYSALHNALRYNKMNAFNALLEAGATVDLRVVDPLGWSCGIDDENCTTLQCAVLEQNYPAVLILLQHGADVNAAVEGDFGGTSLHMSCAVEGGDVGAAEKVVSLLLRWGADETVLDSRDQTPVETLLGYGDGDGDNLRLLLTRAPADRAWRRRGWLVMLRSRVLKEEGYSFDHERAVVGSGGEESAELVAVMHRLLWVHEDGVFRTIVSYLRGQQR